MLCFRLTTSWLERRANVGEHRCTSRQFGIYVLSLQRHPWNCIPTRVSPYFETAPRSIIPSPLSHIAQPFFPSCHQLDPIYFTYVPGLIDYPTSTPWSIQVRRAYAIPVHHACSYSSHLMPPAVHEIAGVIKKLTTGTPDEQKATLNTYFTSDASFVHPFCWVPPFPKGTIPLARDIDSLWAILGIYRWYRILSPHIDIEIDSAGTLGAPRAQVAVPD